MMKSSAVIAAARQLEKATRAFACDPDCVRCRGTIAATRAIVRGRRGAP